MVRKDEKTPNGGDYSEIYFFDEKMNTVEDVRLAKRAVIRECKKDGTLVFETWGVLNG